MGIDYDLSTWTSGCEHEFGDWDRRIVLPENFGVDTKDVTIVNSNGIAADPKAKLYHLGGEINTPPTHDVDPNTQDWDGTQEEWLELLKDRDPVINYRSNLHVHIRVPGLSKDLEMLKQLQQYITEQLPTVIDLIEPIPEPTKGEYLDKEEYVGAMRRYRRRKVSHHTMIPESRVKKQLKAKTLRQFFEAEVPHSAAGRPLWHFQPRAAVNLRQLLDTDTVEFRHFPGTLDSKQLRTCINWCRDFLIAAIDETPIREVFRENYLFKEFPGFPLYVHWMETRYRATCHDGTLTKSQIAANIKKIEEGKFDGEHPCRLSR